jgi:hypothetical protein
MLSCPTARTISYVRLGLSWPELKEIVLDPSRNQAVTAGRRYSYGSVDLSLSIPRAVATVRLTAVRLGRQTLTSVEFEAEWARIVAPDRRAYRHGRQLDLPRFKQITRVTGGWGAAAALAGLDPSARSDRQSLSVEEMLDLHLLRYGFQPSAGNLWRFAKTEGLRLDAYYADGYPARTAAWRTTCEERGLSIAPPPKGVWKFDYGPPVPWDQTDRRKGRWSDAELVQVVADAWARLAPGEEMNASRYQALHKADKKLPSISTFQKYGRLGFGDFRDRARELRFAALAVA